VFATENSPQLQQSVGPAAVGPAAVVLPHPQNQPIAKKRARVPLQVRQQCRRVHGWHWQPVGLIMRCSPTVSLPPDQQKEVSLGQAKLVEITSDEDKAAAAASLEHNYPHKHHKHFVIDLTLDSPAAVQQSATSAPSSSSVSHAAQPSSVSCDPCYLQLCLASLGAPCCCSHFLAVCLCCCQSSLASSIASNPDSEMRWEASTGGGADSSVSSPIASEAQAKQPGMKRPVYSIATPAPAQSASAQSPPSATQAHFMFSGPLAFVQRQLLGGCFDRDQLMTPALSLFLSRAHVAYAGFSASAQDQDLCAKLKQTVQDLGGLVYSGASYDPQAGVTHAVSPPGVHTEKWLAAALSGIWCMVRGDAAHDHRGFIHPAKCWLVAHACWLGLVFRCCSILTTCRSVLKPSVCWTSRQADWASATRGRIPSLANASCSPRLSDSKSMRRN
jgi:hypothetical protein